MTKEIVIEDLRGLGMTAKLIDAGKLFATYDEFARKAGYHDAICKGFSGDKKSEALLKRSDDEFKVLARGNHEGKYYSDVDIYVIESEDGERFLIGDNGLEIEYTKGMTKSYEELLADMTGIIAKIYEKGYDKGYEHGKFDHQMEKAFEDVSRVVNEEAAK